MSPGAGGAQQASEGSAPPPAPGSSLTAILLSKKADAIAALAAKQAVAPPAPAMVSALGRLAKYKRREQRASAALAAAAAAAAASDGSAPSSPAAGAGPGAEDPHMAAVQAALESLVPAELLSASGAQLTGNVAGLSALFEKRLSEASAEALAALQDVPFPELPPYLADLLAARLAEMPMLLCNPQSRAAAPAGLAASASASDAFTAATAAAQDATAILVAAGTDALSTMPQSLTAALGGTLDMASLERMVSGAASPVPGDAKQPAAAAAAEVAITLPVPVARSPTPGGDGGKGAHSISLGGTHRGRVLVWPSSADGPEALLSDDGDEMSSISTMLTLRLAAAGQLTVCTGNSEGTIQLWSASRGDDHRSWARGRCLGHPAAHFGSVDALAEVEHPGEGGRGLVLSGGADGTVRLWCPLSGAGASAPLRHDGGTTVGAGLGPGACVTGGQDGHLRFWQIAVLAAPESPTASSPTLDVQLTQRLAVKGSAPITAVVGLPGGRCATGEALPRDRGGCHVTLWSSAGERERCVLIPAHATCMCLLPLSSPPTPGAAPQPRLAVGTADGTISILLAEERAQEQSSIPLAARQVAAPAVTVKAHPVRLTALACGSGIQPSSGATLASVAADGSAAVWAVATGRSPAMAKRRGLVPPLGGGNLTAVTVL